MDPTTKKILTYTGIAVGTGALVAGAIIAAPVVIGVFCEVIRVFPAIIEP